MVDAALRARPDNCTRVEDDDTNNDEDEDDNDDDDDGAGKRSAAVTGPDLAAVLTGDINVEIVLLLVRLGTGD